MRIHLENVKKIGRKIGLNEEKGFAVAIFLALFSVSATVIGYYIDGSGHNQNPTTQYTCLIPRKKQLTTQKF
jgi:hypothetical protein